jgi:hypothetical protein
MTKGLNIKDILKIQEILTDFQPPTDIQDALDNYTHVTQRGDKVDFGELNIIHVLRAYLKEKKNG